MLENIKLNKNNSKYPSDSDWSTISGFKLLSIKNIQVNGQCAATLNYAGKQGYTIGEVLIDKDREDIPIEGFTILKVVGHGFKTDENISFDMELK